MSCLYQFRTTTFVKLMDFVESIDFLQNGAVCMLSVISISGYDGYAAFINFFF